MLDKNKFKKLALKNRQRRVRKKISGTTECPRLCVYKSLKQIYAQIIDDTAGKTLFGVSSLNPEFKKSLEKGDNKTKASRKLGLHIAKLIEEKGIKRVVFDRNRYRYHGRVKALADGVREGGFKF